MSNITLFSFSNIENVQEDDVKIEDHQSNESPDREMSTSKKLRATSIGCRIVF